MTNVVEGFSVFSGHIIKDVILTNMSYHDLHLEMSSLWCCGVDNSQQLMVENYEASFLCLRPQLFSRSESQSQTKTGFSDKPSLAMQLRYSSNHYSTAKARLNFLVVKTKYLCQMIIDFHPFKQCHGHPSGNLFSSLFIHREWLEFRYHSLLSRFSR